MFLFYAVLLLCIVSVVFSIVLLGARKLIQPWYAGEFMQTHIWSPGLAGGVVIGLIYLFKSVFEFPPSVKELSLSAVSLVAAFALYRLLNVRGRLASYEEAPAGELVSIDTADKNRELQAGGLAGESNACLDKAA